MQSVGRDDTKDISFTVSKSNLGKAVEVLKRKLELSAEKGSTWTRTFPRSPSSRGMVNNPGVAAKMFEALFEANINIKMISTSEIKVSVLIEAKDAAKAVRAVHDKFMM